MSNSYYTPPTDIAALTRARSGDINLRDDAVDAAFDKVPAEEKLKRGTVNYAVTGGAADAYTVTLPYVPSGYVDGLLVNAYIHANNTGAATVNVNSLGVKSIKRQNGDALTSGDLQKFVDLRYSTTTGFFHVQGSTAASVTSASDSAAAAASSASAASSSASSAAASATAAQTSGSAIALAAALAASSGAGLVGHIPLGTGSVATTVQTALREIIVFRRFGVVADGVTDDSTALQSLVNALYDGKPHTINFYYASLYLATAVKLKPGISITNATIKGSIFVGDEFVAGATPANFLNPRIHNIDFTQDSLVSGTFALKYQMAFFAGNVTGCTFTNYDKAIWVPQQTVALAAGIIQHAHRLTIENCKYNGCNYFFRAEKPTTTTFGAADIHIVNSNGEAKIANIRGEGIDGIILADNTFFMTGFAASSTIKQNNVYLDYVNWPKLTGNNYFEAGLDAINIKHFRNLTITGGAIAWPGQADVGSGIHLEDGDLSGTSNSIASITGVTIQQPTQSGIVIDSSCGKVCVSGNTIDNAGYAGFYYGTTPIDTNPHYGINVSASANQCNVVGNLTPTNENTISGNNYFSANLDTHGNAGIRPRVLTLSGTETTVSAFGYTQFNVNQSAPSTITTITDGVEGQDMLILAFNGNTTFTHSATLKLRGGVNATLAVENNISLEFTTGKWYEVSRNF